jgi:hypothetical protein
MNESIPYHLIGFEMRKQGVRCLWRKFDQLAKPQGLLRVIRLIKWGLEHYDSILIPVVCLLAKARKNTTRLAALESAPAIMKPVTFAFDSTRGGLVPEELLALAKVPGWFRQSRKGAWGDQKGSPGKLLHLMMILEVNPF